MLLSTPQQKKKITGTNNGRKREPLPGATIMIEGTQLVPSPIPMVNITIESTSESQKLIFSFMGYKTQIVNIKGILVVDITMIPDFQTMKR